MRKNIPIDREEEIISAFLISSSLLGEKLNFNNMNTNYYYEPKILKLFSHYYNERNVLFEVRQVKLLYFFLLLCIFDATKMYLVLEFCRSAGEY